MFTAKVIKNIHFFKSTTLFLLKSGNKLLFLFITFHHFWNFNRVSNHFIIFAAWLEILKTERLPLRIHLRGA